MVKHMNNACYHYKNEGCFDLKSLYSMLLREGILDSSKEIMGAVIVKSKKEQMPLKIVFVRNRNNADKHICLLSADTFLEDEQIIKTYARRWNIEVSFYNQKQFLGLESFMPVNTALSLLTPLWSASARYCWSISRDAEALDQYSRTVSRKFI